MRPLTSVPSRATPAQLMVNRQSNIVINLPGSVL